MFAILAQMVSEQRRRGILAGLVVAHVLLNGVALAVMLGNSGPDGGRLYDLFLYAILMLGPSQATLLAFWAMLGGGKFLWRVLPAVLGVILYLWRFRNAQEVWRVFIFVQFCFAGGLLGVCIGQWPYPRPGRTIALLGRLRCMRVCKGTTGRRGGGPACLAGPPSGIQRENDSSKRAYR
jgi:hypothetical protein